MLQGIKHLIECQCVLPQFRGKNPPVYHKFLVFSILKEDDSVIEKIAQCNNCGIVHKIYDICKSSILVGDEDASGTVLTKEDMKLMLPSSVSQVLESYNCDITTWEECLFVVENNLYSDDKHIVLTRDNNQETGLIKGKLMRLLPGGKIKLESYVDTLEIDYSKKESKI
jgi:hypothetical protein